MTSTPHRPECAAKTTFSRPTNSSVCQRSQAEQDAGDLAGRQVHGGHDHAVEEQPQVDRAEAAHDARRLARVADLVELQVGHHARAPPQPRVEEHRRDAGQHERPPDPVAGHALAPDDVGHQVGRVAAEGGGDHREPGEPPGHRAARGEELGGALAGPLPEEQRGHEADGDRGDRDHPVQGLQLHGSNVYLFGAASTSTAQGGPGGAAVERPPEDGSSPCLHPWSLQFAAAALARPGPLQPAAASGLAAWSASPRSASDSTRRWWKPASSR